MKTKLPNRESCQGPALEIKKSYQLACISTHLDRIIERDKGNIPEPSDSERKDASLDHAVRDLEN